MKSKKVFILPCIEKPLDNEGLSVFLKRASYVDKVDKSLHNANYEELQKFLLKNGVKKVIIGSVIK